VSLQYELRALLVGCPGLLSRSNQALAEREHEGRVFQTHGLNARDFSLLTPAWCKRYVNARRQIERALTQSVCEAAANLREQGFILEPSRIALPPVS
jgi:hypothetical protein